MSETSASKQAFDPEKFCECPNCFSVHRRGSVAAEIKPKLDPKECKYCLGTGFVDHIVDGEKLGVRRCTHSAPQEVMPF